MIIAGLDLSILATGIAAHDSGEVLPWDIQTIAPPKGFAGMKRLDWLSREICNRLLAADLIVCEDIAFSRNGASHSEIVMLHGFIRRELWIDGRTLVVAAATTLKKFATGRGNAEKDQISKEVFRRWAIDTADNNQSDAVVLAQIGRALVGDLDGLTKPMQEALATVRKSNAEALRGIKAEAVA